MKCLSMVVLGLLPMIATAQEFVNLTFDSPDFTGSLRPYEPSNPRTPFIGKTSRLLPGWTLLGNGVPISEICYRPGSGYSLEPLTFYSPWGGADTNYRLLIISSYPNQVDLRFQQTGRISADTVGLQYFANGPMEMLINGRLLHTVDTRITTTPVVDVSEFAGQVVNLEFHVFQLPFTGAQFEFDIKGFTQVPEPSTWALFGCGAVIMGWMIGRKRSTVFRSSNMRLRCAHPSGQKTRQRNTVSMG